MTDTWEFAGYNDFQVEITADTTKFEAELERARLKLEALRQWIVKEQDRRRVNEVVFRSCSDMKPASARLRALQDVLKQIGDV